MKVVLGVTGSIAAYKACELVRLLVKDGHDVAPVLTADAERFVAAKRARRINNSHQQLGEGTFEDFPPPLVESQSKNYLTMSMEEISEGMIKYQYAK